MPPASPIPHVGSSTTRTATESLPFGTTATSNGANDLPGPTCIVLPLTVTSTESGYWFTTVMTRPGAAGLVVVVRGGWVVVVFTVVVVGFTVVEVAGTVVGLVTGT